MTPALLVCFRESCCCKEVVEASGKFTFEGVDVECILSHSDYNPLTNRTVLLQVGPLLKCKSGKKTQAARTHTERVRGDLGLAVKPVLSYMVVMAG